MTVAKEPASLRDGHVEHSLIAGLGFPGSPQLQAENGVSCGTRDDDNLLVDAEGFRYRGCRRWGGGPGPHVDRIGLVLYDDFPAETGTGMALEPNHVLLADS
jgi:hypothetical protein